MNDIDEQLEDDLANLLELDLEYRLTVALRVADGTLDKMISKFEAWFWAKARNMKMQIDDETAELVHTHYLSDAKWLCEDPARIDNPGDFVVMGMFDGMKPFCKTCQQLLTAHNAKEEYLEKMNTNKYGIAYIPDYSAHDRYVGALHGALISSAIWILLITLFFIIVGR